MRERQESAQELLAEVLGDEGEDELPDRGDGDPDGHRVEARLPGRAVVEGHDRRRHRHHERDLQHRSAEELQVARVVLEPPLRRLHLRIAAPPPQRDGPDLLHERARRVEDQIEESADDRDRGPVGVRETTSHVV